MSTLPPINKTDIVLYLAGPMAKYADRDYNYPEFERCAKILRSLGYKVVSPHEVDGFNTPGSRSVEWYTRNTLRQLLACNAVVVLPESHDSVGVTRELMVANWLKMPIFTFGYFYVDP